MIQCTLSATIDLMTPVGILQVGHGPLNLAVQSLQMRWPFWHCSMATRGRLRQVVQITSSRREASRGPWEDDAPPGLEVDVPDMLAYREKVKSFLSVRYKIKLVVCISFRSLRYDWGIS